MVPVPSEDPGSTATASEASEFVCPTCNTRLTPETGRLVCANCGTVLRHGAD